MNQSCLDVFYKIMRRTFITNEELAIVQKECVKHYPNCFPCRYYKEEEIVE